MRTLTIVMYHYVRDLKRSRYPNIKGRDITEFKSQIDYIRNNFTPVSVQDVIGFVRRETQLPNDAVLLTFDDGYADHWNNVFPILHENGLHGAFFPPARTIEEGVALDVNLIHYILASEPDTSKIINSIKTFLNAEPAEGDFDFHYHKLAKPSRFDDQDIVFIKRLLQRELPLEYRKKLCDMLFRTYVSVDPAAFSAELYMNKDQICTLVKEGMYVGSHGYDHFWLSSLDEIQQRSEIEKSIVFLREIGTPTKDWVMCYPYGDFDATLLNILREKQALIGLTTEVSTVNLDDFNPLLLPRLDTNDLPY